jgi:hypothetical protein
MSFTRGRKAIGICDLCGTQWKLAKLKYGALAGRTTRSRLCPDCWDADNPRDRPAIWTVKVEAIAVRDPRPDPATAGMNSLGGFNPVLGTEIPVFPVADGFSMSFEVSPTPRYILTEDGEFRLAAEDGGLIWAEED